MGHRVSSMVVALASLAGLMFGTFGSVLASGKPTSDIPLLVTFGSGETDSLKSDGLTAPGYDADYANGLENVLAILQPSGNFRFYTQNDTRQILQRRVCFDFGGQNVPFQSAQCVDVGATHARLRDR